MRRPPADPPPVRHNPRVTAEQARALSSDLIAWVVLLGAFLLLASFHFLDVRRRRLRRRAIRTGGDYGPRSPEVLAVLAAAAMLDPATARRLAGARRRTFDWDPRMQKPPKAARTARDRAFANERDDRATAAAEEARERATIALAAPPAGGALGAGSAGSSAPADPDLLLDAREAAECAAETAGAIVAAERIPAPEYRLLTRAWREVIGSVAVRPPRPG